MGTENFTGAPRVPSETSSGPLRSQFSEGKGSKRNNVKSFLEVIKGLGYKPELILMLSNKQRERVMEDLRHIAERPEISIDDAANYFQNQAEINNAIAEAFRKAGITGENPKDIADNLQKEIPDTKEQ